MQFESFPLIKPSEDVESANNHNDWSDQEADDLFNAPLEQVISQMRFKDNERISRTKCITAVIYFSLISFVIGLSFAYLTLTRFNIHQPIILREIKSSSQNISDTNSHVDLPNDIHSKVSFSIHNANEPIDKLKTTNVNLHIDDNQTDLSRKFVKINHSNQTKQKQGKLENN